MHLFTMQFHFFKIMLAIYFQLFELLCKQLAESSFEFLVASKSNARINAASLETKVTASKNDLKSFQKCVSQAKDAVRIVHSLLHNNRREHSGTNHQEFKRMHKSILNFNAIKK